MSEALVPAGGHGGLELEVSATTPLEMAQSQSALVAWCARKIEAMKQEAADLAENLAIAIKNKWKTNTLRRYADVAKARVTFYEKIKAALEAGYCIVPNFPVTLFAIRTDKDSPSKKVWVGTYRASANRFEQSAKMLPAGEGEYKDPNPFVKTTETETVDRSGKPVLEFEQHATHWDEEITFPIQMAKPTMMQATSQAMLLKVFDQLGIMLPRVAKADPLIVGEILDPRPTGWSPRKRVTFIIGWHLDVRDL